MNCRKIAFFLSYLIFFSLPSSAAQQGPRPVARPEAAQPVQKAPVAKSAAPVTETPLQEAAPPADMPGTDPENPVKVVDFARPVDVLELRGRLTPFRGAAETQGRRKLSWYLFRAQNSSDLPVSRIVEAEEAHGRNIRLKPYGGRPAIRQVTSASPNLLISRVKAYGSHAYRLRLPPHGSADVAVALTHADDSPSLMAWAESALATHNRWIAVYATTVAVLIAAAACIAGGLALIKHQPSLSWGTAMLFSLLLMQLAKSEVLDAMLSTPFGGPYGLETLFTGLSLASGSMLLDRFMPFGNIFVWMRRHGKHLMIGILTLSVLAYLGLPGVGLLLNALAVIAVLLLCVYVLYGWRLGIPVVRGFAPAAVLFALYALISASTALGLFGADALTPDMSGAFLAAAVILCVLSMATDTHKAGDVPEPSFAEAQEAIGAARQGVFVCDFGRDMIFLSPAAAALFGWRGSRQKFSMTDWLSRMEPSDQPHFSAMMAKQRKTPGGFFRLEFRAKNYSGETLWFELRAVTKGAGTEAENCVGMLADISARKTAETAACDARLRDPLTGAGNRMALIRDLESMGGKMHGRLLLLADLDGFCALRGRLGDARCDQLLKQVFERLNARLPGAAIFRVGGDSFAILPSDIPDSPMVLADGLLQMNSVPYKMGETSEMAPFSLGLAEGGTAKDPLHLICNAELALRMAQKHGACARIYVPGMEALASMDADGVDAALIRALDGGEIQMAWLPLIRLEDETVAGFRARLVWRRADGVVLDPCALAAYSDNTELVTGLQRLMLENAVARLTEWQQYFPLTEPLCVTVPVMGQLLRDDALDQYLTDEVLAAAKFAPGSLLLELNHRHLQVSGLDKRIPTLKNAGAGVMLAKYAGRAGEGAAIESLPFDHVATDRGLANYAHLNRETGSDIPDLVAKVHVRGGRLLADGVDSADVATTLAELGADFGCGGLFSTPLDDEAALKFIAAHFRSADSEMAV